MTYGLKHEVGIVVEDGAAKDCVPVAPQRPIRHLQRRTIHALGQTVKDPRFTLFVTGNIGKLTISPRSGGWRLGA